MWKIQNLEDYDRQLKWYTKKRRRELSATLANLEHFFDALQAGAKVPQLLAAHRFLHPEKAGVIAVDQRGGGVNLAETRLYTYPDEPTETLYLITIGDKGSQQDDIQFSKGFVTSLRKSPNDAQERTIGPADG